MGEGQAPTTAQLYSNWLDWVHTNLGSDAAADQAAANAAVDAVVAGRGLANASAAAANAWNQAGGRAPTWRLTQWGLLVSDRYFLGFAVVVLLAQGLWFTPGGPISLLLDVLLVPPLWLKMSAATRLAHNGIVAPGSLVKTSQVLHGRGTAFSSTYEFEHAGSHLVTRVAGDTAQSVLVLFDPNDPRRAAVIPMPLSTAG